MEHDRPHVLVVEDELLIALDVMNMVEDAGCVAVGPCGKVEEAMEEIQHAALDGAVLDVNLPDGRVWPVADLLVEEEVPFILATGYADAEIPQRFLNVARLTKPVSRARLDQALQAAGIVAG